MKVLHINASTRGADSQSLSVARHFISSLKDQASIELDEFNLFEDELPKFDGLFVGAKMALFTGSETNGEQKVAWEKAKAVFDRFAAADAYVFNIPLWNNGIPYVLKQFIDVVTQPGWAFGFDPQKGYSGLLAGKRALIVHASGVYYQGIAEGFGDDLSTPYIESWLRLIGVNDVDQIHVSPTVVNPDYGKTKSNAEDEAGRIAKKWAS